MYGFFREYVVVKIGVSTRRAAPFQIVCVVFLGWLKDWDIPEFFFSLVDWHIGKNIRIPSLVRNSSLLVRSDLLT